MKITRKKGRPAAGRRRPGRKNTEAAGLTGQFLRRTFYYLKGEQFLKTSNMLLCEAV